MVSVVEEANDDDVIDKALVMVVVIGTTLSVTYPPMDLLPFNEVR